MIPLTALVLTYNEEANLRRTLESLRWIEKVIVLDSFSTDTTIEVARSFPNVELRQREFDTHAMQWNAGLDLVETEWVLALDADYVVPPETAAEVGRLKMEDGVAGYSAEFRYLIFGKPLRVSIYPPRVVLFRTKRWRYVDEGHTQQLRFVGKAGGFPDSKGVGRPVGEGVGFPSEMHSEGDGKLTASPTGEDPRIGRLASKILHDDRKTLTRWLSSQDSYAKLEARYLVEGGRMKDEGGSQKSEIANESDLRSPISDLRELSFQDKVRKLIFVAPIIMPVYLLFVRGLILDGWRGWYYVFQRTVAELLLSLRLIELRLSKTRTEICGGS